MKVDVYPNITNVEVLENPVSVPVEATWEKVTFTVPDPVVNVYDLGRQVATDRDGDYVIQVHYNATVMKYGDDFTLAGTNLTWVSPVALEVDEKIIVWYSPKSAYGSVPGSGEVTSLTHLNDVTIAGPLAGHVLMRDDEGQFVNRHLTAGANVTITSNGDGITIASAAGGGGDIVSASTITEGKVRLATLAESSGNSNTLAVTPAGIQQELSSIASTDLTDSADLARLASPALTGAPTSPTPAAGDNTTKIATTAYVQTEIAGFGGGGAGAAGNVNVSDGAGGFNTSVWSVSNNHLLPSADDTYDIGSATNKVRDIYVGANSIKIGDDNTPLGVDAQGNLSFGTDEVLTDATLATVATSGQYADLLGAPTLSNVATSGAYADLSGAPTLSNVATTGSYSDLIGAPTLSNVATSGSYNDLSDKPTIPGASTDLSDSADLARLASPALTGAPTSPTPAAGDDSTKIATTAYVQDEITNLGGVNSLDDLSDVALTGTLSAGEVLRYDGANFVDATLDYSDLSNTPTLPSSSDDLTSDHTGVNYTGALNATMTAHLSGIDTALGNVSLSSISKGNTSVDVTDTGSNGTITLNTEGTDRWKVTSGGHILPDTNADYDIGEAQNKVRHLFLSDNSLKFGPSTDNTITGTVSASGDGLKYNNEVLATETYVTNNAASELSDLTDVSLTGTLSAGEVIKYNGSAWVDSALASTDLSDSGQLVRSSDVGTAAAEDIGTTTGDVVQLEDVSGSAGLPAVDASQVTGLTVGQVSGALTDITNESLNDLSDVSFSAGVGIDGYVLTYNHTNTQWEATGAQGETYTVQTADITVSTGSKYIIPPTISATITLTVPLQAESGVIEIINLSSQTLIIKGTQGFLFTGDGSQAPNHSNYSRILYESKGTVKLVRDKGTGINGEWYSHFHFPIETTSDGVLDGDALVYEAPSKSFKPSGINPGEFVLSANVVPTAVSARHKYVTSYNESTARTIEIGNPYDHASICEALDTRRLYFENRGSSTLTIDIVQGPYVNNVYYRTYFYNFDGTGQSGGSKTLKAGECAVIECEYDSNPAAPVLSLKYQLYGHNPERIVETDSTAANANIVLGNEHHKLVNVDNGATAVTVTLPLGANTRDGYLLDVKVLGTGTVTLQRGGTESIDADTSITLSQYQVVRLLKASSGWSVLHKDEESVTEVSTDTSPSLGGNLDVDGNDIVSSSNGAINLTPDGSGLVTIKGNLTGGSGQLKLNCEQNSHGVILKGPPHSAAASYTLTLPDDTGSANELLKTDGSGGLSWSAVGGNDVVVPHTGVNYSAANTDNVTTHLSAIDTALSSAGASDLNSLSDVVVSTAATGEVLRYDGGQWVDAQLSYNDLSNTPTQPSSSDDLTSDHTGVNYTGATTDTVTTHLSGIDTELNNRADTVNSVTVANGAVTIDSDNIVAARTGTNYTAANTDTITTHLSAIDTALAGGGGGGGGNANLTVPLPLSADLTIGTFSDSRKVYVLTSSADRTINLPAATGLSSGQILDIKTMSNVTFTITPNGTDNLDGVSGGTLSLNIQYSSVTMITDGSQDWYIV